MSTWATVFCGSAVGGRNMQIKQQRTAKSREEELVKTENMDAGKVDESAAQSTEILQIKQSFFSSSQSVSG